MSHLPLPLVPFKSQFDGGALAASNCTITSIARLLRWITGNNITGSRLRTYQSDQSGGTSIPDGVRAVTKFIGKNPGIQWAAPNDGTTPSGRIGDYIGVAKLRSLLDTHHIVVVQGDFDQITDPYSVGSDFQGEHAFTVDGRRIKNGSEEAYVVDTQPRSTSGYKGVWMPFAMLLRYAYKLSGSGRIYAAWGRPAVVPGDVTQEPEVVGLRVDDFRVKPGTVKVKAITGVQAVQIADRDRFNMPAGTTKPVIGTARVIDLPGHENKAVYVIADRSGGITELAVILAAQVDFTPTFPTY